MRKNLLLSLSTGVLLSLAFPPFKLGFVAYFALIPFFILLKDKGYKESIRWGYLTGLFMNLGTLYWINWVTVPGAIAAILYLPVYFVLYAWLHTFIRLRVGEKYLYLSIPFLWTGIEFIRSLGVLGFPWNSLAYTQSYYLSLIQYVSFTSVYGVSFWIVTINIVILMLLKNYTDIKKTIIYFIILILLLLIPWLYGRWVIPNEKEGGQEKIRVALIQGNIDPYLKWDDAFFTENLKIYCELTESVKDSNPDLIIWPETATPVYLRSSQEYLSVMRKLIADLNVPLITGTPDYQFLPDRSYETYNAVFLLTPGSHDFQIYRKIHLVPFGERVPFTDVFPFIADFLEKLEFGEGNFSPGREIVSFKVPLLKRKTDKLGDENGSKRSFFLAPVVICFESLFSELVRDFVNNGADILIIITNDAWFGKSQAPYHHAQAAVFRAIENRISIARCANTGVSMFIDPFGRTLKASPIFKRLTLVEDIPVRKESTFFSDHGHIFTIAITLINMVPLGAAVINPRKRWS